MQRPPRAGHDDGHRSRRMQPRHVRCRV